MNTDAKLALERIAMGERIGRARSRAGLSIAQLARLLRITVLSARLMERGERRIYADELMLISANLDVSLGYLLGSAWTVPPAAPSPEPLPL